MSDRAQSLSKRVIAMLASLAAAFSVLSSPASARAEGPSPNDYCQKVSAQADADAALLYAPTVHGAVIRYPASGVADATGTQIGKGIQPRVFVSLGVVDIVRGGAIVDVARADCRRQLPALTLQGLIMQRADIGRLPALERKLAYLREHRPEVQDLVHQAEERLAARATTALELHAIRSSALQIDRNISDVEREIAVLRARSLTLPDRPILEVLHDYEASALDYEKSLSHVRKIQPWQLNLSGGVTPYPEVDYFAVAELSYNVGGIFQSGSERREVEARARELRRAPQEMRHQIEALLEELRVSAEQAKRDVALLDEAVVRLDRERDSLEGLDAPGKAQFLAALALEKIGLEADRIFLVTLAERQSSLGGRP